MSDTESEVDLDEVSDSLHLVHQHMEQLAHLSKHIYTRALKVYQLVEHPEIDMWAQIYRLHDKSKLWAKRNMVSSKCSLWQIHETLLQSAKKDGRLRNGKVTLTVMEAEIMELPEGAHEVWTVLGRLPKFFE
jgi:hypothetical protein